MGEPDNWQRATVGQLCDFSGGYGFRPNDWSSEGLPIIRIQNLNGSEQFNCFAGNIEADWLVHPGTILFAWAGTRGVSFGPTIWNGPLGVLNQHIYRIHPRPDIDPYWLYSILQIVTNRIERKAHGFKSTLVHVHKSDITDQVVALPPLPEQRKIAEILGTWDAAIGRVEQLIAALQRRKQGLMQRLLTGAVRFPEFVGTEWEELRLGEFLKYTPRKVEKPASSYVRMGIRSHGKGTFTEVIDDPTSNAMDFLFEVKGDDLIVNITFAWEQAIAIVDAKDAGALVSHRFPTYEFDRTKVVSEFFRYLMLTERFRDKLELITPGGAGRNRVMNKTDFLKLTVRLPSVREQQRIGEVLMATNKAIDTYQQYLAALSQQKKGLMQRLLTGQVQVKVGGE